MKSLILFFPALERESISHEPETSLPIPEMALLIQMHYGYNQHIDK